MWGSQQKLWPTLAAVLPVKLASWRAAADAAAAAAPAGYALAEVTATCSTQNTAIADAVRAARAAAAAAGSGGGDRAAAAEAVGGAPPPPPEGGGEDAAADDDGGACVVLSNFAMLHELGARTQAEMEHLARTFAAEWGALQPLPPTPSDDATSDAAAAAAHDRRRHRFIFLAPPALHKVARLQPTGDDGPRGAWRHGSVYVWEGEGVVVVTIVVITE